MPLPPIDTSKVPDPVVRKTLTDGISARDREISRLEVHNRTLTTDIQSVRANVETLTRQSVELATKIREQETLVVARDVELSKARAETQAARTEATALKQKVADVTQVVGQRESELEIAKARIAELLNRPASVVSERPAIAVDAIMNHFRTEVERINSEVRAKGGVGGMLVEGCEVEIKGGIDVTDGIRITQLAESALGANTVSTLRFALKSPPMVRIVDDE